MKSKQESHKKAKQVRAKEACILFTAVIVLAFKEKTPYPTACNHFELPLQRILIATQKDFK